MQKMNLFLEIAQNFFKKIFYLIYPPLCPCCRKTSEVNNTLCKTCFANLRFITPPFCALCGLPFEYDFGFGSICLECTQNLPYYNLARAVFAYDDNSRPLVTRLKYADATHLVGFLSRLMQAHGNDVLQNADLLIPVPLHWRRIIWRRYNQAALLAQGLSRLTNIPVALTLLKRVRATPPQTGLSRAGRQRNVRAAFAIDPRQLIDIKGKIIVLVDDVMTTGSTIEACSRLLLRKGALEIRVLTIARRLSVS